MNKKKVGKTTGSAKSSGIHQSASISHNHFNLEIKLGDTNTLIVMKLLSNILYTKNLPLTLVILKKKLPGVLKAECFNEKDIPFHKEVTNTELGHLFEHILIEYLCRIKYSECSADVAYEGVTEWDWKKDKKGTFRIMISAGVCDKNVFNQALKKSISLFNLIMESKSALKQIHLKDN